jgi:UDP-N-acetylmuramate--alanine ligase
MLREKKKIHFIGIGGVGMSGLALILKELGHHVSGCDLARNKYTLMLEKEGIRVFSGHSPLHLEGVDVVVYSSAISKDNPELLEAKRRGLWVIPRAQMLSEIMSLHPKSIVVAGSHGKTTTTSMIAEVLLGLKKNPTIIVGGIINNLGGHSFLGSGEYLVAEADESDGSFLCYNPYIEVITNIDKEHLDFYASFEAVKKAFVNFINRCAPSGQVVMCGDDRGVREVASEISGPFLFYGFGLENELRGVVKGKGAYPEVEVLYRGEPLGSFRLRVPGRHNILNGLASIGVAISLGLPVKEVLRLLSGFRGASRRLEFKGIWRGALVYDDYAHHPSEIRASLEALRELYPDKSLFLIFQPHRYTRTKALWEEFLLVLKDPEVVVLTEIYPASETPLPGISGESLFESLKLVRGKKPTFFAEDLNSAFELSSKLVEGGEVVVTMGAGDIYKLNYLFFREGEGESSICRA